MVLPAASSPPALVVNENVAAAPVFPATLSEAAIENEAFCTCPPIFPELTLEEAQKSFEVFTLTAIAPAVAAPMVKPLIVTVNAAEELMVAPDVLNTIEELLAAPNTMFKPDTLLAPAATTGAVLGVTEGAKKLGGYVRVKAAGGGSGEYSRKDSVIDTFVLPSNRSDAWMCKDT
jgi:hypothetical protein